MERILDLQSLYAEGEHTLGVEEAASTQSVTACSTNSFTGCSGTVKPVEPVKPANPAEPIPSEPVRTYTLWECVA